MASAQRSLTPLLYVRGFSDLAKSALAPARERETDGAAAPGPRPARMLCAKLVRVATPPLYLSRAQVLAHRRRTGALDERLPPGSSSLERAAWAGLQDSMPRAAVLSINARVAGTEPSTWEDSSLVQLWGPRFNAYVVAARDRAVFTLGRRPPTPRARIAPRTPPLACTRSSTADG